jgi:hypothetical protein
MSSTQPRALAWHREAAPARRPAPAEAPEPLPVEARVERARRQGSLASAILLLVALATLALLFLSDAR